MENQTTAPEVQSEQTESVVQNTEATPQQTVLTETEQTKEVNFKVSVDEILKKVGINTKIVFIANPNNPTGTYLKKKELLKLRKKLNKKILLVVDDENFEYMTNKDYSPALNIFKNFSNVFILRTFSKIHGLASLRVGWGYGDKKIIKEPVSYTHLTLPTKRIV